MGEEITNNPEFFSAVVNNCEGNASFIVRSGNADLAARLALLYCLEGNFIGSDISSGSVQPLDEEGHIRQKIVFPESRDIILSTFTQPESYVPTPPKIVQTIPLK